MGERQSCIYTLSAERICLKVTRLEFGLLLYQLSHASLEKQPEKFLSAMQYLHNMAIFLPHNLRRFR